MKHRIYIFVLFISYSLLSFGQTSINLERYRARVLEYNPTIKQFEERVQSADANARAKKKDYLPSIDAAGEYTYLQNPIQIEIGDNSLEGPQKAYSITAPIVQNIYSGGAVRKSNEMANLQRDAASLSQEDMEDQLLQKVELSFWKAIYDRERIELASKYKAAIDELVDVIGNKVSSQIMSRNDLLLLEVRQNEAELFGLMVKNQYEVSIMELNRLMGYPLKSRFELEGDLGSITEDHLSYNLINVYEDRPDIKAQRKKIEIQETNANITKSKYLPKVHIAVVPSYGMPNTNIGSDSPNYNTSFMAGIKVPITRWGKKKQEVSRELHFAESLKYELEEIEDRAILEVNSSKHQLKEAKKRVELTASSLRKSEENLEIIKERYMAELTSILQVLDAQFYWQKSYKDMLDAQYYYQSALTHYKKATGNI